LWVEGFQHGFGIELINDKSKYEGSFFYGVKQGTGVITWKDSSEYCGGWIEN
jgi:hypothetical protein